MLTPPLPYTLRRMARADIPGVVEVDQLSYPRPTRASFFEHELGGNDLAHYHVVVHRGAAGVETIVGFAGVWFVAGEIHVSTIAVHPDWRGRHLGELLFLNLLLLGCELEAFMTTLEVRTSNLAAQQLYAKYRLEEVGRRKRYYRDTGEDAILMTVVTAEHPGYCDWLAEQGQRLVAHLTQL